VPETGLEPVRLEAEGF